MEYVHKGGVWVKWVPKAGVWGWNRYTKVVFGVEYLGRYTT